MNSLSQSSPQSVAHGARQGHNAQRSRSNSGRDFVVGKIGDHVKCDAAGAEGSEKGAGHEQPNVLVLIASPRVQLCSVDGLLPLLPGRKRPVILRRSGKPIGIEAEIFRLPA